MAGAWVDSTIPSIISILTTQHASFLSDFSALTTNADRMEFCLAEIFIQDWTGMFVHQFVSKNQDGLKCSETAGKLREIGNDYFRAKNYEKAIEFYSGALCFAPQSMDTAFEVALAYANRSATYLQVGQHESALQDIDAALEFGYARFKSVIKLQLRKCDCLIRLGRAREARQFLLFMQQPTEQPKDSDRWSELLGAINLDDKKNEIAASKAEICLIDKLAQKGLFTPNEKMSSLSAKVAVCYDAEKGRHLVAKEDIQFGDILGVSRPYLALFSTHDDDVLRCHHCCRDFYLEDMTMIVSLRTVPCTVCSKVMFCSEECRAESSNSYHRYECGQYTLLDQFSETSRMPLLLLYRAGMDQIRAVVSTEQEKDLSFFSEQPEDHYSHVYHLVHHSDGQLFDLPVPYVQMLEMSLVACILFQLAKHAHFPMATKQDEKLISGLLLRHLFQLRYNLFVHCPLSKLSRLLPAYLYPVFSSTLNHSCMENARLELPTNENVCLLQAARPIRAGTEITISYENDQVKPLDYDGYRNFSPEKKVADLQKRYDFRCNCVQCQHYIRNMPFGLLTYVPLSCSDCGQLMQHFSKQKPESEVFRCTNCPLVMNHAEVKRRYSQHDQLQKLLGQLNHQVDLSNVAQQDSLFRLLESAGEKLESLLHRDSSFLLGFNRFLISLHYQSTGRLDKWWACIEQYLTVTERLFGQESVQFIQEFNRILVVQAKAIEKEPMKQMMMMQNFKQQHSELYERYLARVEQCQQLKLKYYLEY